MSVPPPQTLAGWHRCRPEDSHSNHMPGWRRPKLAGARRVFRRAPFDRHQPACKPGSGWHAGKASRTRDGHSSWTPVARRLQQPTRTAGSGHRSRSRKRLRTVPIRSCSRWGLPCRRRCRRRGALLPHRFTLAAPQMEHSGLFSVALSLGSRPPDVIRHRRSMEPGLSSPVQETGAAVRPTDQKGMGAARRAVKRRGVRTPWRGPPCCAAGRGGRAAPARFYAWTCRRRRRPAAAGNDAETR